MKEGILEIQTAHDDRKGHHYYTRRRSIVVMTLAVIMLPLRSVSQVERKYP